MSLFGKAYYNFDKKNFLDVTVRRDGSSRLGSDSRWGTFPVLDIVDGYDDRATIYYQAAGRRWINRLEIEHGSESVLAGGSPDFGEGYELGRSTLSAGPEFWHLLDEFPLPAEVEVWQVEQDPYRRAVLARHFPDAERFERDLVARNGWPFRLYRLTREQWASGR
jgi:hypothetical protein